MSYTNQDQKHKTIFSRPRRSRENIVLCFW